MTPQKLKKKHSPPILWQEYRTSVESVETLWMTGTLSSADDRICLANFHILYKDGTRKDFLNYTNHIELLKDVEAFLRSLEE